MTEDLGMEAAVSLDAMIERHIAALSATSEAVCKATIWLRSRLILVVALQRCANGMNAARLAM
jgi:hypothetical protein